MQINYLVIVIVTVLGLAPWAWSVNQVIETYRSLRKNHS